MKMLRIPGSMLILLLSFLALSLSTSVPLAWATAGTITEFPVPIAGSEPWGITLGPDGKMWFTDPGANKIGRITTSGTVTEFLLPSGGGSFPQRIASGRGNKVWFTEEIAKIGRITTS